jgi:hypothetical protein|tara:strand:- start:1 stop:849 length:849 start_codon:yes stop_codon:yes gene_type:complete
MAQVVDKQKSIVAAMDAAMHESMQASMEGLLDKPVESTCQDSRSSRNLLISVAVSLLFHTTLLLSIAKLQVGFNEQPIPEVVEVEVHLVATNPLTTAPITARSEPPPAVPESEITEPAPEISNREAPLEEEVASSEEAFSAPLEPESVPQPDVESTAPIEPQPSRIFLPSVITIQETLQQRRVREEGDSKSWLYDCNTLEEESTVYTCDPEDRRDYRVIESNPSYQALNPIREISRSQRSLPVVATNAPALAARLANSDIPQDLSDYVLYPVSTYGTDIARV